MSLDQLPIGSKGTVTSLALEGAERRRLLDLGLSIGAEIEAVRRSPLGDPVAYLVRGSTIAIRREQAQKVEVEPC
jgi:ferrous iron transport protein A